MIKPIENIRIEEVGDINSDYPYLEVFYRSSKVPFLEISISDERKLVFTFYASQTSVIISDEEMGHLITTAKDFLPKALKNEDDYLKFLGE